VVGTAAGALVGAGGGGAAVVGAVVVAGAGAGAVVVGGGAGADAVTVGEPLSIDEVPPLGVALPPQLEIPIMINTMKSTKATRSLFAFIDGPF
jgi:hypothetical protein